MKAVQVMVCPSNLTKLAERGVQKAPTSERKNEIEKIKGSIELTVEQ